MTKSSQLHRKQTSSPPSLLLLLSLHASLSTHIPNPHQFILFPNSTYNVRSPPPRNQRPPRPRADSPLSQHRARLRPEGRRHPEPGCAGRELAGEQGQLGQGDQGQGCYHRHTRGIQCVILLRYLIIQLCFLLSADSLWLLFRPCLLQHPCPRLYQPPQAEGSGPGFCHLRQ